MHPEAPCRWALRPRLELAEIEGRDFVENVCPFPLQEVPGFGHDQRTRPVWKSNLTLLGEIAPVGAREY